MKALGMVMTIAANIGIAAAALNEKLTINGKVLSIEFREKCFVPSLFKI